MREKHPIQNPWWTVLGCMIALMTSTGPILFFGFSLFLSPIATEFGVSRSTISVAYSVSVICTGIAFPVSGYLIDRFGIKRITLIMITGLGLSVAAISRVETTLGLWTAYGLAGIFGSGHSTLQYSKLVSGWFKERRGLALGVTLMGNGLGALLMPMLISHVIVDHGWRAAYVALGAAVLLSGWVGCGLLAREAVEPAAESEAATDTARGVEVKDALRDYTFWAIGICVTLVTLVVAGVLTQVVPMLTDGGVPQAAAAGMLMWVGIGATVGRLSTGFAYDRLSAPLVSACIAGAGIPGLLLLVSGETSTFPALAMFLIGLSSGAEGDMIGYLTARYFGLKRFGTIYGFFFVMTSGAQALGGLASAGLYDLSGSYLVALQGFVVLLSVATVLIMRIRREAPSFAA